MHAMRAQAWCEPSPYRSFILVHGVVTWFERAGAAISAARAGPPGCSARRDGWIPRSGVLRCMSADLHLNRLWAQMRSSAAICEVRIRGSVAAVP